MSSPTRWVPSSSTVISDLPSLTRNERAKMFSTVWENDDLFSTNFSNGMHFRFFKVSNIVKTFFSVSVLLSSAGSSTYNRSHNVEAIPCPKSGMRSYVFQEITICQAQRRVTYNATSSGQTTFTALWRFLWIIDILLVGLVSIGPSLY